MIPQGLKALSLYALNGTTEVVPFPIMQVARFKLRLLVCAKLRSG